MLCPQCEKQIDEPMEIWTRTCKCDGFGICGRCDSQGFHVLYKPDVFCPECYNKIQNGQTYGRQQWEADRYQRNKAKSRKIKCSKKILA